MSLGGTGWVFFVSNKVRNVILNGMYVSLQITSSVSLKDDRWATRRLRSFFFFESWKTAKKQNVVGSVNTSVKNRDLTLEQPWYRGLFRLL